MASSENSTCSGALQENKVSRRTIFAALPAALVAAPAAALCIVDPDETPVMRLFREWKVAFDRTGIDSNLTEEALEAEVDVMHDLVVRMVTTPAENARDICAKLTAFTFNGEHFADDDGKLSGPLLAEARALVA